jgi:hypothetical protein
MTLGAYIEQHMALFYPQTWYRRQGFMCDLLGRLSPQYRLNQVPKLLGQFDPHAQNFTPSVTEALVLAVEYRRQTGNHLWPYNFVWCRDLDDRGDRLYVGGSLMDDTPGIQIHRHLTPRNNFYHVDYVAYT